MKTANELTPIQAQLLAETDGLNYLDLVYKAMDLLENHLDTNTTPRQLAEAVMDSTAYKIKKALEVADGNTCLFQLEEKTLFKFKFRGLFWKVIKKEKDTNQRPIIVIENKKGTKRVLDVSNETYYETVIVVRN